MVKIKKGRGRKRVHRAEAALEAVRGEQVEAEVETRSLGRPINASTRDESLFFVDKAPTGREKLVEKERQDARRQRKRHGELQLKSLSILAPRAGTRPVPDEKVRAAPRLIDGIAPADKRKVGLLAASGAGGSQKKRKRSQKRNETYDIWNATEEPAHEGDWWKVRPRRKHTADDAAHPSQEEERDTRQVPAGLSINPVFEDHQDLLGEVVAQKLERRDEQHRVDQKLHASASAAADDDDTARTRAENYDDDNNDDGDDAGHSDHGEEDPTTEKAALQPAERKTRAQRNRDKRRRVGDAVDAAREMHRQKLLDLDRVDTIVREIEDSEIPTADKMKGRLYSKKRRHLAGRRLPEPSIDVQRTADLKPQLRAVQVQGSLLRDKFVSLQRRGLAIAKRKSRG